MKMRLRSKHCGSVSLARNIVVTMILALVQPVSDAAAQATSVATDWAVSTPYPSESELGCMAQAIVYEAGREPIEGQQAVAQVIVNRMRAPRYPKTVCGVVYQGSQRRTGCQFTFTCDGSLARKMPERLYLAARTIALDALRGVLPDRVGAATHYHAYYVSPYWAPSLARVAQIGAHIFYRDAGHGVLPGAQVAWSGAPSVDNKIVSAPSKLSSDNKPFTLWGLALPNSN